MRLLLDSVILIDHLSGRSAASEYLRARHADLAISLITRAEVLAGIAGEDEWEIAVALLDALPLISLSRDDADRAARLRQVHGWKLPDAFQAAVALRHGLSLVTRNTRDFPPQRFDFVVVPYEI